MLKFTGARIESSLLPGRTDLSQVLTDAREIFGENFTPPVSDQEKNILLKDKEFFTAGEDNLVMRGVVSGHDIAFAFIFDYVTYAPP